MSSLNVNDSVRIHLISMMGWGRARGKEGAKQQETEGERERELVYVSDTSC